MKKIAVPVVLILAFGTIGMISLLGSSNILFLITILVLLVGLFAWVMPLFLKRVEAKVWIISGFVILLGLLFPTSALMSRDYEFGPFSTLISTTIFLLPSLALVNAAFLLYSGLPDTVNEKLKTVSLGLCTLLIIKTLYNLYVLTLWDNTYDSLGYLWLIIPTFAVLLSGIVLFIALPQRTKPVGIFYVLLIPILLVSVSMLAQRVDYRQETAKRAENIVQALEDYYGREEQYPETLSQLTPWYVISLSKPMIIYGQDWCYESGDDYYRLGYVDHEHWSSPYLIRQVYKTAGEYLETGKLCEEGIARLIAIDPMLTVSE